MANITPTGYPERVTFLTDGESSSSAQDMAKNGVAAFVLSELERFSKAREQVEANWLECWSLYLGSPEAILYQRARINRTVGDVGADWRHRINTGKGYEAVETIVGYIVGAMFPNREFFQMLPTAPGYLDLSRVVSKFMMNKMNQANFRDRMESFVRQCVITGNSVMAIPWRYETATFKRNIKVRSPQNYDPGNVGLFDEWEWKIEEEERTVKNCPEFETLDVFDCYLDPSTKNPDEGAFIRRLTKTRVEVKLLMRAGVYNGEVSEAEVDNIPATISDNGPVSGPDSQQTVSFFHAIDTQTTSPHDIVELYEYWGDVVDADTGQTYYDVCVTVCGGHVLSFEPNPYWGGRPFVWGTYTDIGQIYGLGAMQPNLGLLQELNIVTNQRLDNQELSINSMWTTKQDGIVQPDDVYTEPGKVFTVLDHDDIQPLAAGSQEWQVTYQEVSVLEQLIDKNFATGAMIGAGQGRTGERVTATEITAVRDAGGNRLSSVHRHIESTSLLAILRKTYDMVRQFVKEPEVIRVAGAKPGEYQYYRLNPEVAFVNDFTIYPVGADFVVDRTQYVQQRMEFIAQVAAVPQMAQKINWEALLYDIVHHMGFEDPSSYIMDTPPQPPTVPGLPTDDEAAEGESMPMTSAPDPNSPEGLLAADEAMKQKMNEIGGASHVDAYQSIKASGQLPAMLEGAGPPIDPITEPQL